MNVRTSSAQTLNRIDAKVSIETPEQIQFTFEVAGAAARMAAYLIDLLIRLAGVFVLSSIIFVATGLASPGLATGLVLILVFLVEWGYCTLFEWLWSGYTPGKRALGIRVVRTDGIAIDFVRSAMRNLLRAADFFPALYATGLIVMFVDKKSRRLGDFAADAMVIREKRVRLRRLPALPSNAAVLPAQALGALRLKEPDISLIDEFFRRRHLFSTERSTELAAILAEPAAAVLGLPNPDPEAVLAGIMTAGHERRSSSFSRNAPPRRSSRKTGLFDRPGGRFRPPPLPDPPGVADERAAPSEAEEGS